MPRKATNGKREQYARAINKHVGGRVKLRRNLLGLSQQELGTALGLTFQQIQKYEKGMNRVSAGTLFTLSKVLAVPVSYFFEDIPTVIAPQYLDSPRRRRALQVMGRGDSMLTGRKILNLARAFSRIRDDRLQDSILQLVRATAERYEAVTC